MIDNILDYLRDFSTYDFLFLGAIIAITITLIALAVFKTRKRDEIYDRSEDLAPKKNDAPEVKMALASNEVINVPGLKSDIINLPTEEIVELPIVINEPVVIKTESTVTDMEKLLSMMQKDLEVNTRTDAVEVFEKEQEENAIISYKELLTNKDGKTEIDYISPIEKFSEFEDEPLVDEDEVIVIEDAPKVEERVINNKFINSEFISPIFGRLENKNEYPSVKKELSQENIKQPIPEKSIVVEALSEEIVKNDEFLNALKEFRKNL